MQWTLTEDGLVSEPFGVNSVQGVVTKSEDDRFACTLYYISPNTTLTHERLFAPRDWGTAERCMQTAEIDFERWGPSRLTERN